MFFQHLLHLLPRSGTLVDLVAEFLLEVFELALILEQSGLNGSLEVFDLLSHLPFALLELPLCLLLGRHCDGNGLLVSFG